MSKAFIAISIFGRSTLAYSVFNTHCTLPAHIVNYVSSPNTRGTIDVAWSCFATIVACVYTVLHLNLPRRPEHVSPGRKPTLSWENDILTPGAMVFIGTFCPEWIFTVALMEFWDARHQLSRLKTSQSFRGEDEKKVRLRKAWKLSHMFFANMGGFVLMYKTESIDQDGNVLLHTEPKPDPELDEKKPHSIDMGHAPSIPSDVIDLAALNMDGSETSQEQRRATYAQIEQVISRVDNQHDPTVGLKRNRSFSAPPDALAGGLKPPDYTYYRKRSVFSHAFADADANADADADEAVDASTRQKLDVSRLAWGGYRRYHLSAAVYRHAIKDGLFPPEAVPEEDINDRAKSDWFVKILIVFQLISFWCNILARVAEGLPICALEVATSAFAICSFLTYALLFQKPQAAFAPIVLGIYPTVPEDIQRLKMRYNQLRLDGASANEGINLQKSTGIHGKPPFFLDAPSGGNRKRDTYGYPSFALLSGFIFGALHLAGWFLEFPSEIDLWLWRGSSLATTAIPILTLPFTLWLGKKYEKERDGRFWDLYVKPEGCAVACVVIPTYILARLILLVETIRSLFYLPVALYETPSWPIGIPHIS